MTDANTGCPEEIANEPAAGKRNMACNIVIIMTITSLFHRLFLTEHKYQIFTVLSEAYSTG